MPPDSDDDDTMYPPNLTLNKAQAELILPKNNMLNYLFNSQDHHGIITHIRLILTYQDVGQQTECKNEGFNHSVLEGSAIKFKIKMHCMTAKQFKVTHVIFNDKKL